MSNISNLWEFKYAPKTIGDMILPEREATIFNKWLETGDINNCLLVSSNPGCGKTTLTNIFKNSGKFVPMFVNASRQTGIDTVRETISDFAKTVSMSDVAKQKLIILDEADRMTQNALDSLKAEIEMCISNARFIFTANRESAFPEPIKSRLAVFNFDKMFVDNRNDIMKIAFKRITSILNIEEIKYDNIAIVNLIKKISPDWRSLIKKCQILSAYDKNITQESVNNCDAELDIDSLISIFIEKDFTKARTFSIRNAGNEVSVMNTLWKLVDSDRVVNSTKPSLVIILADMNRYIQNVPDPEIELMNTIVQIMSDVKFNEE